MPCIPPYLYLLLCGFSLEKHLKLFNSESLRLGESVFVSTNATMDLDAYSSNTLYFSLLDKPDTFKVTQRERCINKVAEADNLTLLNRTDTDPAV